MNIKKMNIYILTIFMVTLFACGDNSDTPENKDEDISQEEFDNLNKPCVDESISITLPAALSNADNYLQYEQTILINSVIQLSNSLRESLNVGLYPPNNAVSAAVDGININAGDKGYEWTVDGEKFVYIIRDNGYQIYYYEDGSSSGREVVNVDQDENCESFNYIQYAYENEGDQEVGDIVFSYSFSKALTTKNVEFGTDLYKDDSESYTVNSFEDLSGQMTIETGENLSQDIIWNADGSGTYQIVEDNQVISQGVWSF